MHKYVLPYVFTRQTSWSTHVTKTLGGLGGLKNGGLQRATGDIAILPPMLSGSLGERKRVYERYEESSQIQGLNLAKHCGGVQSQ